MGSGFLDVLEARDVSAGGLGLTVPHRFVGYDLEGEIQILIKLPGLKPFLVKGVVRRKQGAGDGTWYGIEFTQVDSAAHQRLIGYIEEMVALGRTA